MHKTVCINYYFRDNFWLVSKKELVKNNIKEKKLLENLTPKILNYNSKIDLNFNDHNSYYGLGWSRENNDNGIWTDGFHSSILFSINKVECVENSKINFLGNIFTDNINKKLNLKLFLNKKFVKEVTLEKDGENILELKIDCKNNESFLIDLLIVNPISERELLIGLNTKKKGFLLKSIHLSN